MPDYGEQFRDVHVAILAGGSGTRLWPLSRREHPKQFLSLIGDCSLLQSTVERVRPLVPWERIYILTGREHAEAVKQQLPALPDDNVFVEPSPKGTAPCLGLAATRLRQRHSGDSVMVSLHADHAVQDVVAFQDALAAAVATARHSFLVTVGIVPNRPETGFGYIERGESLPTRHGLSVYRVARFREKPDRDTAQEFVESGRFYWNTGYFAWTLDNILERFQVLLPETHARLDAMVTTCEGDDCYDVWAQIAPVSIDVGIMEKARRVAVVPSRMGWSDVGNWAALYDLLPEDARGNVAMGTGQYVAVDSEGGIIHAPEGKLVATIGCRDMVVIDTGRALLVLPKRRAQEVSGLVKKLRAMGLEE